MNNESKKPDGLFGMLSLVIQHQHGKVQKDTNKSDLTEIGTIQYRYWKETTWWWKRRKKESNYISPLKHLDYNGTDTR